MCTAKSESSPNRDVRNIKTFHLDISLWEGESESKDEGKRKSEANKSKDEGEVSSTRLFS